MEDDELTIEIADVVTVATDSKEKQYLVTKIITIRDKTEVMLVPVRMVDPQALRLVAKFQNDSANAEKGEDDGN